MPIETDSGNIDFVWRFSPKAEGEESISFPLRLHKTKEFGSTISFLDEENKPVFSLPADFMTEVGEHIAQYRPGIKPSAPKMRTVAGLGPSIQVPKIGGRPVPVPIAQRPAPKPVTAQHMTTPDGRMVAVTEDDEVGANTEIDGGIYLPPGHEITDADLDPTDPVFQTFTSSEAPASERTTPTRPPLSEAQILAERERAKNNPNKKTGIKKRHAE